MHCYHCMHVKSVDMSTMTIRNIDDNLKARLRVQAAEHGRSREAEVREILRAAVLKAAPEMGLGAWFHVQFAEFGGVELDIPKRDSPARYATFDE